MGWRQGAGTLPWITSLLRTMAEQEKGQDSSSGEGEKESAPKLGNERPTIGPQGEAIVICHQGRFLLLVSHLFLLASS